ncbi:DMT family transporter [Bacteroidales bacterium OttesenSCG-928-L03]|nr:DMT family transporter [Bacteroidales bacterium OttesenSCG-928-L03]
MKNISYIFMVLLGGAMYGTMSSFVKLSYSWGYHAAEIAFSQAALAALFLSVYTLATRKNSKRNFTRRDLLSLLLTGSAIGLTNFLYYQSVHYISASLAIVILMQFTWFSILLEWVLFTKKPSRLELITVFFILIGTVMAGNLFHTEAWRFSMKGILLSLFASLTYAVYIVANGRVGKCVRWQSKSSLIMVGSALTIFLINQKEIVTNNHFGGEFLLWALFLAIVGTTIPTALFAAGIPRIGAGLASILMTVELPVAVICAWAVLREKMNPIQIAGIIIMLAAISAMNYYKSIIKNHPGILKSLGDLLETNTWLHSLLK